MSLSTIFYQWVGNEVKLRFLLSPPRSVEGDTRQHGNSASVATVSAEAWDEALVLPLILASVSAWESP
jgi:hypothetical protein